ncbi:MAG: hypothetical protein RLZZ381_3832, partial [Cyanobacteriota bacterium]
MQKVMFNRLINLFSMGTTVLSVLLFACSTVRATPLNSYQDDDDLGQVTNVNQLRDVAATDWAYEALRSLVQRYGC